MQALEMLLTGTFPESFWDAEDDACDCTFQRIGMWTNPYVAETLEVRMCCIWAELYKLFPQHVRVTPAYLAGDEWDTEVHEWDGESDMPRSIWYRHLARKEGITVPQARAKYASQAPPAGTPRPEPEDPGPSFTDAILTMMFDLSERLKALEEK